MMVTIDGIRYRVEDAEALGLIRLGVIDDKAASGAQESEQESPGTEPAEESVVGVIDDKAASTPVNRGRAK